MAVATAAIAAAGLGMSAAKYIKQNKAEKDAAKAASKAAMDIANIKEQNPFSQVQVPTLGFDLAQQGLDRYTASALSASQAAGAEGVIGSAGNIVAAQNAQELDLAAQADQAKYQRDAAQAAAQSEINARKSIRDYELGAMKLTGAQQAKADAQAQKADATSEMFGAATSALGYAAPSEAYKQKRKKKTKAVTDWSSPSENDFTGITSDGSSYSWSSLNNPTNPYNQ